MAHDTDESHGNGGRKPMPVRERAEIPKTPEAADDAERVQFRYPVPPHELNPEPHRYSLPSQPVIQVEKGRSGFEK